jgi:hypothetical protein
MRIAAAGAGVRAFYGVVTYGTAWKFPKLDDKGVTIDLDEYPIECSERIMGMLFGMMRPMD